LDQAAGQPLPYRHLTLVGPQGNGISITLADATETLTVDAMQVRLHQETLILPVEPDLVADLDTVLLWFLLNAVTWDTGEEFEA
ncbi:MAG: hypothetical protein IGQ88_00285, partial [Gloeomargaritaceae cyanobacterium C42_A2020_066]|nr:hypothetical protein [Gloeomargaritaceae cyanobacterium C42_A2020_066]